MIQLKKIDIGQTKVMLDHLDWLDGEKWDEAYAYFDHAWNIVLNSLEENCLAKG